MELIYSENRKSKNILDMDKLRFVKPPNVGADTKKVELTPHNPAWREDFDVLSDELHKVLHDGGITKRDHSIKWIGSTSLPIAAKNIMDLCVIIENKGDRKRARLLLEQYGFDSKPSSKAIGVLLKKASPNDDDFVYSLNHIGASSDNRLVDFLLFKKWLTEHEEDLLAYEKLKISSARTHGEDIRDYTRSKYEFVQRIIQKARQQYTNNDISEMIK